jgi:[ribosomal protein S5]-alanine N-acetyltransferase
MSTSNLAITNDFPTLHTQRLVLRQILIRDAGALFANHSNAVAMALFGSDPLTDIRQAHQLIATFEAARTWPNPGIRFAIALKTEPELLIGSCGIFKQNRAWHTAVLGYDVAAAQRGRGIGGEAIAALLTWAFDALKLNRIEAQVHPENIASIRLLTRHGFLREALQREAGFWGGQYQDLVLMGLLRRDWRTR